MRPSAADDATKVKGKLEGQNHGMEDTALTNAHCKVDSNNGANTLSEKRAERETMRRNTRVLTNMHTHREPK